MSPEDEGEKIYYGTIMKKLRDLFKEKGTHIHLEITANKVFSNELKSYVPRGKEIIFLFLKQAPPDITGFVKGSRLPGFVVVEVKSGKISLSDIYQLKRYADLFDARFSFLVSLEEIPEEIKRLVSTILLLSKLKCGDIYKAFVFVHFDRESNEFVEWFEENPFKESIYWK